jgi:hypothetical protein
VFSVLALVAPGCGPEHGEGGDEPPGTLEYEIPTARFYRLERRVDMIGVDPAVDSSGCGFLTDRAYQDLVSALDQIDPNAEYMAPECEYDSEGMVHLEGFTHGPFACSFYCCHPDLLPIAVVYFAVGSTLDGPDPNIDGEIYVALEPDVPCPD